MKKCTKCETEKDTSDFNKNKKLPDGLAYYCRACSKIMQSQRYEKLHGISQPLKRNRMLSTEERFAKSYVISGECWLWTGAKRGQNGYGGIKHEGKPWMAHRFSWVMHNGSIQDGCLVLHTCDTPKCVNPKHLFLGSHQDNMDDMHAKGRESAGEQKSKSIRKGWAEKKYRNVRHKRLTEDQARAILSSELKNSQLAEIYGVTRQNIYLIKTGKNWKWLTNNTIQI